MDTDRDPWALTCALCGATRRLVAYRVNAEGKPESVCLDEDGCNERVSRAELAAGQGVTFETAAEAITWLREAE